MGKGKLHELLAVEADLEGRSRVFMQETHKVFKDKPALFSGFMRTYKPFSEDDNVDYPSEQQTVTSTVNQKLKYMASHIAKYYDAIFQKEATNQVAMSDLVVDGEVLIKDAPATFLLGLESRLRKVREVYGVIPTLAVGTEWADDSNTGVDIYKMVHPEETLKTQKTIKSSILYEATEHHPAQIDKWNETVNVGKFTKQVWSGAVTPSRKAELLERVDKLIMATKKARQRANTVEVQKRNAGQIIMDYINK